MSHAPDSWQSRNLIAYALWPFSMVYRAVSKLRWIMNPPERAAIPVICVGNLMAGGAGKTPVVLLIASYLRARGKNVHLSSYGYGGALEGPLLVGADHTAHDVGDEALLLTKEAPTWIGKNRKMAADCAAEAGADIFLMDDGFQNPYLVKDLSFLVIDGAYGLGNGFLLPAGPLREQLHRALRRATAVIIMGEDMHGIARKIPPSVALIKAQLKPDPAQMQRLSGKRAIAFAGIGRPQKFFDMLRAYGVDLVATHSFGDHHPYNSNELALMQEEAREKSALLLTTAKDAVKIEPALREGVETVTVTAEFEDPEKLRELIDGLIS